MADEKVTIKIEVNSDVRGAKRVNRELKEIARTADRINAHSGMRSSTRNLTGMLNGQQVVWKKHFDELDKLTKGFGKGMQMGMKLATKAVIAELAILSVSLVGIHGLFAAGQGIMKAYRWALDATGAAATGLVFALSTVAAALREQQAAMYAYKTNTLPQFGSGLNQTRVLMRALSSDSEMAFIGVENLNKAFAAVSKNSTWTANSQQLLRGLMDFAAAGQPLEQGVEKAGELIGLLQDTKSSWGSIKKAAEASSPAMKKALEEAKKQGINTREELINAINSGQLSSLGGVSGQFDAVSGTLINQLKGYFNIVRGRFADLGQQFLAPVKEAMSELMNIFNRMFIRTIPALSKRGINSFTDGIVNVAEKIERLYSKIIYQYTERTEGVFEGISKWWAKFREGWEDTKEALRPFIEGARVIEDALKAAFQPIKETVSGKFGDFNEWLQENRGEVVEFGDKMGKLVSAILKLFGEIGKLYRTLLPFINRLVDGLTQVVNLTSSMFGMFSGMGQFGGLFALLGMRNLGAKLAGTRGGFIGVGAGGAGASPAGSYGPYGSNFAALQQQRAQQQAMGIPTGGMRSSTGGAGAAAATTGRSGFRGFMSNVGTRFGNYASKQFGPMDMAEYRRIEKGAQQPTAFQRSSTMQALRRARYRNQGLQRFQQSGGAKMGVGMGLGMLSAVAPAEMQGALALGGMAAQINPMLGLAVGGIGAAMNAQGGLSGALAGAGGGAAIGAMVGGPVGAMVGAALGGIAGAIRGWTNKSKTQAKMARKAVTDTLTSITTGAAEFAIAELMAGPGRGANPIREALQKQKSQAQSFGDVVRSGMGNRAQNKELLQDLFDNQLTLGIKITESQLKDMMEKPDTAVSEYIKQTNAQMGASEIVMDSFNTKMQFLQNYTGQTEDQILALAKTMGVNLLDGTQTAMEALEEMGKLQVKTAEQMKNVFTEAYASAEGVFDKIIKQKEAPKILDEMAEALSGKLQRGGGEKQILDFFKESMPAFIAQFGSGDLAMAQIITSFFGPNATAFQKGGPFEGMQGQFASVQDELMLVIKEFAGGAVPGIIEQIQNTLPAGRQLGDVGGLTTALTSLLSTNPELFAQITTGSVNQFGGDPLKFFQNFGVGLTTVAKEDTTRDNLDELPTELKTQYETLVKEFDKVFAKYTEKPDWMTDKFIKFVDENNDTATPRGAGIGDTTSSRLAVTMNRHSVMDDMLTGKRNVTSAWRNWGLGSMNSDHVTGRAYDLTGQNLGGYQQLVQSTGGFAEFHGTNANRHLHVVPGPVGDTAVPAMSTPAPTMAAGGSTYNNYNFTVSSNSSDPEVVANVVMRRIEETQRDKRERK